MILAYFLILPPRGRVQIDNLRNNLIEIFKFLWYYIQQIRIGGNVTILPGVVIGEGSVIGAGAVVTKSIPAHTLAFGNPCRVIRDITEEDRLSNHPECYAD